MKGSMLVPPENLEDRLERINPAVTATINWIENVLENSIKSENGFRRALITGEVLCRLLNVVSPGTVKRVNHCPNRAAAADNLTLFLSSCEDKFGVLRSRLFSVSDFEDIFEQDESPVTEIQGIKHTEKIVIALFWLAKAIEQKPDCQNVPRLDYSAFTGLLPKQTIYRTPAISTTDSESVRSKKSLSLERKSSYAGEVALEPHYFVRPQSSSTMGNAQPHSPTSKQVVSMLEKAQTLPSQTNNSALDEDEWQSDLDDWREKRRKASRLQATKMFSLEEQKQEEERKHQAAIRARMQEIKSHRTSVTSSYIPSIDIAQPPPVSSPGMALLTGAAFDLSEISDDSVLSAIAPYGTYNRSKKRDTSIDNNSVPIPNSHSAEVEEFDPKDHNTNGPSSRIHEDVFTSTVDETVQPELSATDACRSCADSPDLSDVSVAQGVHNVVIRLQSKTGATESRWGMTVKAEGPKSNAPFVVDRVKIGSSADVCDVIKGDILVQLNGVDLRKCATNDAFTLHNLEQMMDQLALSGKTTNLTVLRKVSHQDEFSEVESSEPSDGEKSTMNATSGLTEAAATSFSDFDVTVAPSTVIANVETSNISSPNANLLVASESLFVQSVLPVEIPQSDTIMRPIHRSSPIDQSTSQIKEPSREDKDKITQSPKIPLSTSHVTSLVTSLRSPLSTQMVDTAEASASQLNTPSQAEDSTTSKGIVLPNTRHVDITGTEPTYMTLVTTNSQQNDTQADYQIKLPPMFRQDMISATLHNFEPAMSGDCTSISHPAVDSTCLSNSQSPNSPLPPPPSLPLPTSPSSSANAMQLQNLISLEFHPLGKFVYPDADPSTPAHGHMYEIVSESGQEQEFSPVTNNVGFRASDLPSPPPPQFFSPESEPVITPFASFDQTQIMQANGHLVVPNNVSDRFHSNQIRPVEQDQSLSVIRGAPGQNSVPVPEDLSSHPRLNSYTDSHIPTVVTLSPELSIIPPPAPSSPLLPPLGIHRTRTLPMRVVPADESTELIIDDLEGDKDPLVYKRHEPHPRLYAPPPLPKTCRSDPPPQPPRVPMHRFINQKQKCVACTRELGSGDLMLIESMSLYYHLACFVCSRCGVALSDGLSNTDVRIRCGQLYCNDCYPSRHSKGIQQSGGNSHRIRNTVTHTNASLNFSDRRSRPRSQCSQPRGSSTASVIARCFMGRF